jgi:hypothetical protein
VQGRRPPDPKFTIRDKKGEVAARGSFSYG